MRWNLAYRTLFYDRGKLIAGLIGVIFSVVLVNVQGGLFFGLIRKASTLITRSNADIWVGHRGMHNVDFAHPIPERYRYVVAGVEGVAEVQPLRIYFTDISLPDGGYENVAVVGLPRPKPTDSLVYDLDQPSSQWLGRNDAIIVDRCDSKKLGAPEVGDLREVNGRRVRVAGRSNGVLSFLITPYIFAEYDEACETCQGDPTETSYLLVKLERGADARSVCQKIEALLPDASALTAKDYSAVSVNFWMTRTGLGISFGAATILGLLVGLVMVGQTLYAMVLDRINEYATLRAIGFTERELLGILLGQSSLVAAMGIGIGVG
ncbi:MAG: ABC transporter permease, partial [Planctomycetota bacterium]